MTLVVCPFKVIFLSSTLSSGCALVAGSDPLASAILSSFAILFLRRVVIVGANIISYIKHSGMFIESSSNFGWSKMFTAIVRQRNLSDLRTATPRLLH